MWLGKRAKEIPVLCYKSFGWRVAPWCIWFVYRPLLNKILAQPLISPFSSRCSVPPIRKESFEETLPWPTSAPWELVRPLSEVKTQFRDWLFAPNQEREVWWEAWEGKTFPSAPMERRFFLEKLYLIDFLFLENCWESQLPDGSNNCPEAHGSRKWQN